MAPTATKTVKFKKQVTVAVPHGTVDWELSDRSGHAAQIRTEAERAGYRIVGEPEYLGSMLDPDNQYTGSILTYLVEATPNG